MKRINLILMAIAVFIVILSTGCEKNIKGCTDRNSINYDPSATVNDGSCEYVGSDVFWFNQATSDTLQVHKVTSLTFYVNGVIVGSTIPTICWLTSPDCGQNASVTVTEPLSSGVNSITYSYSVTDQKGYVWWSGTIFFIANNCNSYQLY